MKKFLFSLLVLVVQVASSQVVDSKKSKVIFKVNNMNVRTVEGEFTKMTGRIDFNTSNLSQSYLDVCVTTESLQTDTERRNKNLKKEMFFNAQEHPEICFQSQSISKIFGAYIVEGELTIKGVTQSVRIPLFYKKQTLTGNFAINRHDFNLGNGISSFMIDDNVNITIICKLKDDNLASLNASEQDSKLIRN